MASHSRIPGLSPTSAVTLGRLLDHSGSQCVYLQKELRKSIVPASANYFKD